MSSLFEMTYQERESASIMHRLNKSLISAIYTASKEQGISQKEIADRLEVNKSVVSRLLQGRGNPTFRTVADICAAIGVQPDMSFAQKRTGTNVGRLVSEKGTDPTSQSASRKTNSYSFSKKEASIGAAGNV